MFTRRRFKKLRARLMQRLNYWPLLKLLLIEPRFLVAFGIFVGLLIGLGLCLPKLWTTSPNGFAPTIRVSVLDLAQAWSLKRSARNSVRAGQWENAAYCWEAAIANNSADREAFRGMLDLIITSPEARKARLPALPGYLGWLLRLSRTNETDVLLGARALDAARLPHAVLDLLAPFGMTDRPDILAPRLRALFQAGMTEEFARAWTTAPEAAKGGEVMQLYQKTWEAGWGPPGDAAAARAALAAAVSVAFTAQEATRLQLILAKKLVDAESYETALNRLKEWKADTANDHANWWLLLEARGRAADARQSAASYQGPIRTVQDCLLLAEVCLRLGAEDAARGFFRHGAEKYSGSVEIWAAYAQFLISRQKWDELSETVWRIRAIGQVNDPLVVYCYYLEARAEVGMNRPRTAQETLRKISSLPPGDPQFARRTAAGLLELKEARLARDLLLKIEDSFEKDPFYWHSLLLAAAELKEAPLLKKAASRAHELAPNHPVIRNNYAATLLIFREQPDLSVRLCFEFLQANPRLIEAKLNHAIALAQNYRHNEAQSVLDAIDGSRLKGLELAGYQLCRFELLVARAELALARTLATQIDRQQLMQPQIEWLDRQLAKIGGF